MVSYGEFFFCGKLPIAINAFYAGMPRDAAGIAAILGEDKSARVFDNAQFPEIIMYTFEIPSSLVKPAAGLVNRAGGILGLYQPGNSVGVELPPAFVKRNPCSDGRDII